MSEFDLPRRLPAGSLGPVVPLATVVGSDVMNETLAGGQIAMALLAKHHCDDACRLDDEARKLMVTRVLN